MGNSQLPRNMPSTLKDHLARTSAAPASRWLVMLLCMTLAATCGYLLNANINSPCRQQLSNAASKATAAAASGIQSTAALLLPTHLPSQDSSSDSSTPPTAHWTPSTNPKDGERYSSNLHVLQQMLPLTKLPELTTKKLLKAAEPAGLTGPGKAKLMQLHQEAYCRAQEHLKDLAGTAQVPFGNVSLTVYAGHDIVSNSLRGFAHNWEHLEMQQMLWAIRSYKPAPGGAAAPLVVDVGANIGWFMVNAAAAKAQVVAFEAMKSNIKILRSSLCRNPWLAERIALFGNGLGSNTTDCYIISGVDNKGDGHTICGVASEEEALQGRHAEYQVRGSISVQRLDDLVDEDVQVMKIDVEGYELEVLKGAGKLLTQHTVRYIMMECNTGIITPAGKLEYLRTLHDLGYHISSSSFRGPFIASEDILAGKDIPLQTITLYAVKK